jgi:putative CocE/NonD family hydrolase
VSLGVPRSAAGWRARANVARPALALATLALGCVALASCAAPHGSAAIPPAPPPGPADAGAPVAATAALAGEAWVRAHYAKREVRIPMRDGVHLHTAIYTPRPEGPDWAGRPGGLDAVPILLHRTPYGVGPYAADGDADAVRESLGPNPELMRAGYVFVYQDVRGRFMSEGTFDNMRPHLAVKPAGGGAAIDESTDTYDTIAWVLAEVAGHNGRVGMWGISYPGFYAAAGMIDHHPALVAVSPQAPIADWWYDDFHHHGAFFLPHAVNFLYSFGRPRPQPTTSWPSRIDHGTPDGFAFFARHTPLAAIDERLYGGEVAFWRELVAHPNRDEYWQARDLLPHLQRVAPHVLTVGGWYDAEDLYGPLQIYRAVEAKNPGVWNGLVMGPWAHGGWARGDGERLGWAEFGAKTAVEYRERIETPFFEQVLREGRAPALPEASVFETGRNRWRSFDAWPPPVAQRRALVLHGGAAAGPASEGLEGELRWDELPRARRAGTSWRSDPASPVPFSEAVAVGMTREYMTDDQRFATRRPDVLTFASAPLTEPVTLAGPLVAELWFSTTAADADLVVKLIDVQPADAADHAGVPAGHHMGEAQLLVRSEVLRGRFRDDPARPRPFVAGQPTKIELALQDVLHTFEPGHRIMIHVQSSWFPLVDVNPQRWVANVFEAAAADFTAATHTLHHDAARPSRLWVGVLPPEPMAGSPAGTSSAPPSAASTQAAATSRSAGG